MDSRQSPLRLSFETAFKLNQSLYANENTNETLKKNNIKSSSIQINPHSTALSQKRIVPSQESKCISHRKIKENRPRVNFILFINRLLREILTLFLVCIISI